QVLIGLARRLRLFRAARLRDQLEALAGGGAGRLFATQLLVPLHLSIGGRRRALTGAAIQRIGGGETVDAHGRNRMEVRHTLWTLRAAGNAGRRDGRLRPVWAWPPDRADRPAGPARRAALRHAPRQSGPTA